jgi:hypothetical protein
VFGRQRGVVGFEYAPLVFVVKKRKWVQAKKRETAAAAPPPPPLLLIETAVTVSLLPRC